MASIARMGSLTRAPKVYCYTLEYLTVQARPRLSYLILPLICALIYQLCASFAFSFTVSCANIRRSRSICTEQVFRSCKKPEVRHTFPYDSGRIPEHYISIVIVHDRDYAKQAQEWFRLVHRMKSLHKRVRRANTGIRSHTYL